MIESAAATAGEVKAYDFRRPVRITAGVRERLSENQTALAKPLAAALGDRLGVSCDVQLRTAGEGASGQLFETPYDPVFRFAPFTDSGQILLRIDAQLSQALVDRLLGGMGAVREVTREPTEIEAALLTLTVDPVRKAVATLWNMPAGPAHAAVLVAAEERHATEATEGVAATFDVRVGDAAGAVELFYSHGEIGRALGEHATTVKAGEGITWQHVENVGVQVRVQWPPTAIRIRDLAALRVGDVVHLEHKLGDELVVMLGDRIAFRGCPGAVEDAFGVRITRQV